MYMGLACGACGQAGGLAAWYDDIVQTVGDVGTQAVDRIKNELATRYGQAAWDALPDATKRAVIQSAWDDIKAQTGRVPTWAWAAGALALLWLWRR
jgi:MYXO-CTERM domain-containing protein